MTQFRDALATLSGRQKTSRGVSYYSRWVNRPGGRVLAAAASLSPVTPNQVSLLSGLVTAVGIALVAVVEPAPWLGFVVWAVLALGFMLDSADGQLARLRGAGSPAGEWLDHVLDAGKLTLVHAAVLVSWFRWFELPPAGLLVPLVYQAAAIVMFVGGTLAGLLKAGSGSRRVARPSGIRSLGLVPADYGVFCLVFLLLGFDSAFVLAYSTLCALNVVIAGALVAKWFRELKRRPRTAADRTPTTPEPPESRRDGRSL